jgi:hypothetical protein
MILKLLRGGVSMNKVCTSLSDEGSLRYRINLCNSECMKIYITLLELVFSTTTSSRTTVVRRGDRVRLLLEDRGETGACTTA